MRDAVNVDAAAGDVRRYKDGNLIVGEVGQRLLPRVLALVAVNRVGLYSSRIQMSNDAVCPMLGTSENQCPMHRQ
jgi:hypothetical protein